MNSFSIKKADSCKVESAVVYSLPISLFLPKRNKVLLRLAMCQMKEHISNDKWPMKCQWKSAEKSGNAVLLLFLFHLSRTRL